MRSSVKTDMLQSPAVVICDYVGYNNRPEGPKSMNWDVVL